MEIPPNQWVRLVENYRHEFTEADMGFGFLGTELQGSLPEANIDIEEEDPEEDTGGIISGMSIDEERRLYRDLRAHHGTPFGEGVAVALTLLLTVSGLYGAYTTLGDYLSVGYLTIAALSAFPLVMKN